MKESVVNRENSSRSSSLSHHIPLAPKNPTPEYAALKNSQKKFTKSIDNMMRLVGSKNEEDFQKLYKSDELPEKLKKKLKNLEFTLKWKFENNWISVRKAFLDLDLDYDGYIRPEDIARYFSNESGNINYNELKQLMILRGHKKKGYLDFTDFSKWMGSAIQPSGGFFFRHDSIRNPQFETNLENILGKNQENTRIVRDKMTDDNFLK